MFGQDNAVARCAGLIGRRITLEFGQYIYKDNNKGGKVRWDWRFPTAK
jgi:hypothetical protein